jgi:hypothetical protein
MKSDWGGTYADETVRRLSHPLCIEAETCLRPWVVVLKAGPTFTDSVQGSGCSGMGALLGATASVSWQRSHLLDRPRWYARRGASSTPQMRQRRGFTIPSKVAGFLFTVSVSGIVPTPPDVPARSLTLKPVSR